MNEQIKKEIESAMPKRMYGDGEVIMETSIDHLKETESDNDYKVEALQIQALAEIKNSIVNVFKEYFDVLAIRHCTEDADSNYTGVDITVALVSITPFNILISLFPSKPIERTMYRVNIDAKASFKNENGFFVPLENLSPEIITPIMGNGASLISIKTERSLESISKVVAEYFMQFIKDDPHYLNNEKPNVKIVKRTYEPHSSPVFTDEEVEFNY